MAAYTDKLEKARKVSGLTLEEAAQTVGLKSYQTYMKNERNPGNFSVDQLLKLYDRLEADGKYFIRDFLAKNFDL